MRSNLQEINESLEHSQRNERLNSPDPSDYTVPAEAANEVQQAERSEQLRSKAEGGAARVEKAPKQTKPQPAVTGPGTLFINALNTWLSTFSRTRKEICPQLLAEAKQRLGRLVSPHDSELIRMAAERAVMLQVKLEVLDFAMLGVLLDKGGEASFLMKYQADLAKQYSRSLKEFAVLKKLSFAEARIRLERSTKETAEVSVLRPREE